MPPSLDKPGVRGGASEACLFNDHSMCRVPGCGCDCHIKAALPPPEAEVNHEQDKKEKVCPTCGIRRPAKETYCRLDGARLASLLCSSCGSGAEPGDKYCWKCGADLNDPGSRPPVSEDVLSVPSLEELRQEPEFDHAVEVLRGLQAELKATSGGEDEAKRVVEQPMGVQGSFKLVSSPSPNRVRIPAVEPRSTPRGSRPGNVEARPTFRLPVKPS